MTERLRIAGAICLSIAMLALAVPARGQAPAKGSASEFYLQYRKAFDAAKSIDDVMPFMAAKNRMMVEQTPKAERADIFEMIKMMGAITNVKIVKEASTAEGATLTVEAVDADKAKTTGTVEIVKESGAWKLGRESWSSSQ